MAQEINFEDFMKGSVIDLSSIESNRAAKKEQVKVPFYHSFLGSKLWLDIDLDRGYFMHSVNVDTCLQFCYETNYKEYMSKVIHEEYRKEAMICQTNCLNKLTNANDLLLQTVDSHPRSLKHREEFTKIQEQIKQFNEASKL